MQELVWALLAILLFAIILAVGFNTTLEDFLKTKAARKMLFSGIICLGLVLLGMGIVVLIQAKTNFDTGTAVCNTTIYDENLVQIGEEELIEGVNVPVYDKTFAKIEKDKCIKKEKDNFLKRGIGSTLIAISGVGLTTIGFLALCGKIWKKGKKKSRKR